MTDLSQATPEYLQRSIDRYQALIDGTAPRGAGGQLMPNEDQVAWWARQRDILQAEWHVKTGTPMPDDLKERMRRIWSK